MHKLDIDTLVTKALLRRFEAESYAEGGDGMFLAYMQKSDSGLLEHLQGPPAPPEFFMFANDVLTALNNQLHHDGAWCVVFTHYRKPETVLEKHGTYDRIVLLWMDADGDVQFPAFDDQGIVHALGIGLDGWLEQCERCWILWNHHMRETLKPREGQLVKAAKGEMPAASIRQRNTQGDWLN